MRAKVACIRYRNLFERENLPVLKVFCILILERQLLLVAGYFNYSVLI